VREARTANQTIPLPLSGAPSNLEPATSARRHAAPRGRARLGVRFDADSARSLDRWLPLLENTLTTAGYLVLTIGAVALLFRFAP
jgi:hypothetical protein